MTWGIKTFTPPFMQTTDPYLTPRKSPFPTHVPIFVQLSGSEVLYDIDKDFVETMKGVQGNTIELYVAPNAPHDVLLCGEILGFQKEADAAAAAAQRFLKDQGVVSSKKALPNYSMDLSC